MYGRRYINWLTLTLQWEDLAMTKPNQIIEIEFFLGIKFPQFYRQFLLEQGSAIIAGYPIFGFSDQETEEKEKGIILPFKAGDPRKGGFDWVANYQEKIVGLCNKPGCSICDFKERKKLKDFQGGELKVELSFYQKENKEFYIGHFISIPEKEIKREKPKISVLEATEILRYKRPDISKKLVVISSKKDLRDGKEKALCIDTERIQGDDAPLVEISDINQEEADVFLAFRSFKEYLEHLKRLEEENKAFFAAYQRIRNRKNEVRERVFRQFISRVFRNKCPVCEKQDRGDYLLCQQCLGQWRRNNREKEISRIDWIQQKLESKRINVPKFTHLGGKGVNRIRLRAQDWHTRIFRVSDYVVGLTAFRHNYQFNCLEVDEFWCADLYGYKKGQAIRNLIMAVLSEANSLSGSLKIAFTKDIREDEETGKLLGKNWQRVVESLPEELRKEAEANNRRVHRSVPEKLVKMAQSYGVNIDKAKQGKISHQEGVEIFTRAFEFPSRTLKEINKLENINEPEKVNYLTREAVCSAITAGIWSREQVIWFFDNASRPEAVILGTDLPENRVLYSDSLNYGRSVLLAERFQKVVLVEISDGFSSEESETPKCLLEPQDQFWVLKSDEGFNLPWMLEKEGMWIAPKEQVLILSMPRIISSKEENRDWIKRNIALLEEAKEKLNIRIACLIVNYEFISRDFDQDPEAVKQVGQESAQKGIYILVPYERCDQIDLEVEEKMRKARKMRQFPSRIAPLVLQVVRVPGTEWRKDKVFGHVVQNAYDYGRLVANRVEINRYRNDFIITSGAVERMALCSPQNKSVGILRDGGSLKVLEALKSESGVSYSFVRPQEISQFRKLFEGEARTNSKTAQYGIVVVPVPYGKVETSIVQAEAPRIRVEIPEAIRTNVEQERDKRIEDKGYVSREDWIKSAHQQLQEALENGLPLAVSHLQPQAFVETVRDYVYYRSYLERREERFLWIFKRWKSYERREPEEPAFLRIVYSDGTEGQPFPLFSLRKDFQLKEGLYELPAQLVSLRHMLADYATEVSIIRNTEIQRKEDSAEQEDFAFRKVYLFGETFLKLIQGEISIEKAVENYGLIFSVLWQGLRLDKEVPKQGLKLHLFQSTGLEPVVAGAYRAVAALLEKYQGRLVVVPRIYRPDRKLQKEFEQVPMFDNKEKRRIVSEMYLLAIGWY